MPCLPHTPSADGFHLVRPLELPPRRRPYHRPLPAGSCCSSRAQPERHIVELPDPAFQMATILFNCSCLFAKPHRASFLLIPKHPFFTDLHTWNILFPLPLLSRR
ncbi:hypothetical protein CDL15_Pgr027324 [Punica granatum]|uniref:Uncharacterized protein n=1 Tax=Punica granatum TaxID=22663 RepID=A0A218WD33_PUNGR|nr:hypothetical protein CDL15_Pgr027324 [Punica granatum]